MTEPSGWWQVEAPCPCAPLPFISVPVGAGLGRQLGPSCVYPDPAEAGTNCGSLGRSKHVSRGQLKAASDIDLQQSPSQDTPEPTQRVQSNWLTKRKI